jgi:hypothetical protein
MNKLVLCVSMVTAAAGCSKSGGGKYTHDEPHFTATVPGDLTPGKETVEGASTNLSIANKDDSREMFFLWAPAGSPEDPNAAFSRYGAEPDSTKTVEQGAVGPNGKYLVNERGGRTYIHAVITTGNQKWGVLCMASTNDPKKDADLIAGCKSLNIN